MYSKGKFRIGKTTRALVLVCGMLAICTSSSWATTIKVDGWSGRNVWVHLEDSSGEVLKDGKVLAAEFDLSIDGYDTIGYCVELDQSLKKGTYDYTLTTADMDPFKKAAWVMLNYAPGLGNIGASAKTNEEKIQSAAVQLAVWELVFDVDQSVTDTQGLFFATSKTDQSILQLAQSYVDAVNRNNVDFSGILVNRVALNDAKQDLLVVVSTPVPPSVWLLGSGFLAFTGMRLRKRKNPIINGQRRRAENSNL